MEAQQKYSERFERTQEAVKFVERFIEEFDPKVGDIRHLEKLNSKLNKAAALAVEKESELAGVAWSLMQQDILRSWKAYILETATENQKELAQALQGCTDLQKWHWYEKERGFSAGRWDASKRHAEMLLEVVLPGTGPLRLYANNFNGPEKEAVELCLGIVLRPVVVNLEDSRAVEQTMQDLARAVAGGNAHLATLKKNSFVFDAVSRDQERTFLRWILMLYLAGPELDVFARMRLRDLQWENAWDRKKDLKKIKHMRVLCECCGEIGASTFGSWFHGVHRFLGKGLTCKQREMYGLLVEVFRLTDGGNCSYNNLHDRFSIAFFGTILDESCSNRTQGGETEGVEEIMHTRFDWQKRLAELLVKGPLGEPALGKRKQDAMEAEEVQLAEAFLPERPVPPRKRPRIQEILDSDEE